jgi:hypothetical protein
MATKTVAWESGGGYITLTYTGIGNAPISVKSDANESFNDRQQYVSIATTKGSPQKAVDLLVKQKGKTYPSGTVFNYSYTGTVQEVTLPPGRYKLQCWGAQGGNSGSYSGTGSKGGYSEGEITLTEVTTLYIFVGGKGGNGSSTSLVNGGWNGGGGSVGRSSYNSSNTYGISYPACGGGATDIALVTSGMSYSGGRTNRTSASLLSRFIVAGGGAGGSARYTEVTNTEIIRVNDAQVPTTPYSSVDIYHSYVKGISVSPGTTYYYSGIVPSGYTLFFKFAEDMDKMSANVGIVQIHGTTATCPTGKYYLNIFFTGPVGVPPQLSSGYIYHNEQGETSTDTSSGSSNSSQQGGGTSGRGTSPGTQSSGGGEFGFGKNQSTTNYRYVSGAGGGGWYGGGSSSSDSSTSQINSSGGGSGFVNIAANAGYRPSGYTGLQLDSGSTKDGSTSFPSPSGGNETGHSGNGYARITVL